MTSENPNNVILGPARIWVGAFGVTEPALTNAALIVDPSTGWTYLGATSGGAQWEVDLTLTRVPADQWIDDVMGRFTHRQVSLTTNLLEGTMANMLVALNNIGTVTAGSGITSMTAGQPNAAVPAQYASILIDGWAPLLGSGAAARRRGIFRKCLNETKVANTLAPDKAGMFALNFGTFGVSNTIDPFIVEDQTA